MQPKKILPLQSAITSIDGYECVHVASEPVYEHFQGGVAWQGTVEVFDIIGHPKAKRVYAWQYEDDDKQTNTLIRVRKSACRFRRDRRQSGDCGESTAMSALEPNQPPQGKEKRK